MCEHLSVWINGDWREGESGWCGVINQHNEWRWALCRWSPHSGLCHPAGGLFAPLQSLCIVLSTARAAFLWLLLLPSPLYLWKQFLMNWLLNMLAFLLLWWLTKIAISDISPQNKHEQCLVLFFYFDKQSLTLGVCNQYVIYNIA